MTTIALFHSVYGLRGVEIDAARRLRALGHEVHSPDLYAGHTAPTIEAGFDLKDRIGWDTVVARANEALDDLPENTVLIGFSMGAGVIHDVLPARPGAAAVLLLHGLADVPVGARPNLPVQLHIADPDIFATPHQVAAWHRTARARAASVDLHTYPHAGHFYTDDTLPDHDARATELTWQRVADFLRDLESTRNI
ncbi:dienelactone hydrolase [Nocardia transvalensis]|uniref:Dienelactone hydrolase n=1 Tax=Nocardia transvalensis TaxID=37333 RepID=A0A7W9PHV9_9NOCA|nr:dienelactone hydrolase family protein [Nocardia transvalensis]MBB5915914.1 dienelactone hydrolase [Nocardia transvalensis]